MCILITCEAGGTKIPSTLPSPKNPCTENQLRQNQNTAQAEFTRSPEAFDEKGRDNAAQFSSNTIAGCDTAALYAAHRMSTRLKSPLIQYEYTLQAIDVTRSLRHPKLYSASSRKLSPEQRQHLVDNYYIPYRRAVRENLRQMMQRYSYVVHLSVRSFDLMGPKKKRRRADVGLLYDPASQHESDLCADWLDELYFDWDMLKVRRNYPRRGTVDSLVKSMRSDFSTPEYADRYLGIEILLNRAWAGRPIKVRDTAIDAICVTLQSIMQLQQADAA
jgi:predicted N-formylglutamate amidohydrolase